jgi:3-hydroxyacyl-CoA dehydrogenase
VEEVDAVAAAAFGVPKTGVFGLLDLVGLDLAQAVAASLRAQLPPDDPCHALPPLPGIVRRMIAEGRTGRKGAGGFYRLAERAGGGRAKEALDLASGGYRPASKPRLASLEAGRKGRLPALLDHPDLGGRFAERVLVETLAYAAHAAPEIADDVAVVDRAMRLGYGWAAGPFELLDRLGPRRRSSGCAAPGGPRPASSRRSAPGGPSTSVPPAVASPRATGGAATGSSGRGRGRSGSMTPRVAGRRWRPTPPRACGTSRTASPAWSSTPS